MGKVGSPDGERAPKVRRRDVNYKLNRYLQIARIENYATANTVLLAATLWVRHLSVNETNLNREDRHGSKTSVFG